MEFLDHPLVQFIVGAIVCWFACVLILQAIIVYKIFKSSNF